MQLSFQSFLKAEKAQKKSIGCLGILHKTNISLLIQLAGGLFDICVT